ncbi:MAG: type I methionyl aminopeptidase [Proteobacteria bacterium]|nr:type I methionyl aminopeptidase [Pseudomonadota bacterium]
MRESGLVAAGILDEMCLAAKPGVSTWDLDQIARTGIARAARKVDADIAEVAHQVSKLVHELADHKVEVEKLTQVFTGLRTIKKGTSSSEVERIVSLEGDRHRVISAFLGYAQPPYPAVVCTSINEVIVHGIPRKNEIIKDGDIIGIDFGIFMHGFCADTARTIMVGNVSPENRQLVETASESLENAIALCKIGNRIGDLGHAVQRHSEARGYSVVRQFVGHGTGRQMHEDPQVPNFTDKGPDTGKRLKAGLVIAVEPMVNAGTPDIEVLKDEWTAVTKDRKMSAHFEHTIAITEEGPWVLTRANSTPGNPGSP